MVGNGAYHPSGNAAVEGWGEAGHSAGRISRYLDWPLAWANSARPLAWMF